MTPPLSSILSAADLPEAELQAARLDGELFCIDECFSPIDLPEQETQRALALASFMPQRLIAEQRSAAWIWGALELAPTRHQFCVAAGARARPANPRGLFIREVVIGPQELMSVGGLSVTSPLRTALDLTRSGKTFDPEDQEIVLRLLRLAGASLQDCRELVQRRRNLPGKRRTSERLNVLEATQERPKATEAAA